jgi:hypothetical protein
MSYNDFTLEKVQEQFALTLQVQPFCQNISPVQPGALFAQLFLEVFPLAERAKSEKAKSELLISPLLVEIRRLLGGSIEFFSGEEFTVDRDQGLNGFCDFLISKSTTPLIITAPVVMLVAAKRGELDSGRGQCVAEMFAAQRFNQQHNQPGTVYGCVTSGILWQFLKLEASVVTLDLTSYQITPVDRILGILKWMLDN